MSVEGSHSDRDALIEQDLTAARQGDLDALERVLAHVGPTVRRALEINPKWQAVLEPDDIMQVTYMEAFARFDRFVGDSMAALTVWLRQIARHNLLDAIRGLERDKRPHPDRRVLHGSNGDSYIELCALMGVTSTTPSRAVAADEARTLIDRALAAMPDNYATALKLFDLEGQPGQLVADRLGCSRVTAYMLRGRARDHLRDLLGPASRLLSDRA